MRLNFAGVPDDDIREGIRRIGSAMREQLGLLGSLTATAEPSTPARAASRAPGEATPLADVVELPRRDDAASTRRRRDL